MRRAPGGPLGRLDAHGEIRWMLEQFQLLEPFGESF